MLKLYCHCGYPIWVSARWTGSDVLLILQDGKPEPTREAEALVLCPHCHQRLAPAELTRQAPPARRWQEQTPSAGPSREGARSPGKILVVDDDEAIREVFQDVLAADGFQVQGARDGTEALEVLHREGGWVVLLDLMMPRLNGWQVLQQLQQEPEVLTTTKVVVMSAGWRLDSVGQALNQDIVVASLRKPVDLEDLRVLARSLAGESGS